jgi:hypothetical protein
MGSAVQTPRGQLSIIADYLEDPTVTENVKMTFDGVRRKLKGK